MTRDNGTYHYLFGPVPSRRLGKSLGVDIVPLKTCTQNCLYCQLGRDAPVTLQRKVYVPTEAVLDELRRRIAEGLEADFITVSGSGEPTLHSELGVLLDGIKALTAVPVAVITNGTLLHEPQVRQDCAKADVVLPSLDAGDEATFGRINNPHPDLDFRTFVEGLCRFRDAYKGQIWLEVFFCKDINTDDDSIEKIARLIAKIRPDRIQLNTAVRPVTAPEALLVGRDELERIAEKLHPKAEIIADFAPHDMRAADVQAGQTEAILAMLRRRPCSLEDICKGLSLSPENVRPVMDRLVKTRRVLPDTISGTEFYKINITDRI